MSTDIPPFRVADRPRMRVIGVLVHTLDNGDPAAKGMTLGGVWKRFAAADVLARIPGRLHPGTVVAVHLDGGRLRGDAGSIVLGCEVGSLGVIPEDMLGVAVPRGTCLVFTASGAMPQAVVDAWEAARGCFREGFPWMRVAGADLEIHREATPEAVELWVAVEPDRHPRLVHSP